MLKSNWKSVLKSNLKKMMKKPIEEILNWGLLVDHFLMASEFYYLGKDGHCTVEDA